MSTSGNKFYVSFLDHYSKYTWLYPIPQKSDVYKVFCSFQKLVERQFNCKIKSVQTDWGGEYRSLHKYFENIGIQHRVSCPHTSQQNGSIERKHRHIVETGLSLLSHSSVPLSFWDHAFMMATYLINRLPTSPLNTTPLHKLFARDPDFSLMRVFGCACYPFLRPFNKHKLDFRSKQCVFLGISNMHRGYKCLDPSTGKIFVSRHVVFDEHVYPFSQLPPASLELNSSQAATTFLPFPPNPPSGSHSNTSSPLIPDHATMSSPPAISPLLSEISPSSPTTGVSSSPSAQGPLTLASADDIPAARLHQMRTRSQNHIVRPKSFIDGTVRYPLLNNFLTVCSVPETPSSYTEARKYAEWRSAMDDEFSALMKNGTWSLVPARTDMNVVGSMWVLKTKRRSDGTIDRRKARLVAKGYHQQHGIDFDDTFSLVVKPPTIRLVLSIAVSLNWEIHQIDIQNAFLHGLLAEEVYMHQPIGYVDTTFPNHVCKLHKALYGLKQAPRAWYSRLSDYLLTLGFITSSSDTSLFIYTIASTRLFLLVYVDDIVISQAPVHRPLLTSYKISVASLLSKA